MKLKFMKKIAILGSVGSVGTQILDVVAKYPAKFKVIKSVRIKGTNVPVFFGQDVNINIF